MYKREIDKMDEKVKSNVSRDEGQKIWRQFQRFAEYEDLKDLYQKVVPPLSEFQEHLDELEKR